MPNAIDGPALVRLWMELSEAAKKAEALVAYAALAHANGKGTPPSNELQALAADLRALANKYRDLALERPPVRGPKTP